MNHPDLLPECQWAQAELFGPADLASAQRLEQHLAGCSRCRDVREFDRRLGQRLAAAPMPANPCNLDGKVRRLLRRRRHLRLAAAGLAASLLIGFALLAFWPTRTIPSQQIASPRASSTEPVRMNDLACLVAQPPVVPVVDSQSAWLEAIIAECERSRK